MASNRISAANKECIRKTYDNRIKELDNRYQELGKAIAKQRIAELQESEEYKKFCKAVNEFTEWLGEVDPQDQFACSEVRRIKRYVNNNEILTTPYYFRDNNEFSFVTEEMKEIKTRRQALVKECNKIIWDIEMSPKSSKEYKNAIALAENLLFKEV